MNNLRNGSGDKVIDSVVYIGAIMLFAKTADVLSFYSPRILNDILGFDVSGIFGILSAALVEGTVLALHMNRRAINHPPAILVKWVLLAISGLCQVFDGYITTGQAAQMSDTLKATLAYGVPNIPLIVLALIFAIGRLPEAEGGRQPFIGLKNIPHHLKWIWEGERSVGKPLTPLIPSLTQDIETSKLLDTMIDQLPNPTSGKVK
jgi:hypothetical protein